MRQKKKLQKTTNERFIAIKEGENVIKHTTQAIVHNHVSDSTLDILLTLVLFKSAFIVQFSNK